jgi:hypothetical protein
VVTAIGGNHRRIDYLIGRGRSAVPCRSARLRASRLLTCKGLGDWTVMTLGLQAE